MAKGTAAPASTWLGRLVEWLESGFAPTAFLGRLLRAISSSWWRVREARHVVWACRAQLVSVLAGGGLIALTDQARDIVLASAAADGGVFNKIILVATLLMWASVSWYWARVTLNFSFVLPPFDASLSQAEADRRRAWREWWRIEVPRLIGSLAILLVAVAFWKARNVYVQADNEKSLAFLAWSVGFVVLAVAFYYLTRKRIQIMTWLLGRAPRWRMAPRLGGGLAPAIGEPSAATRNWVPDRKVYDRLRDYANPVAATFLIGTALLAPVLSVWFAVAPLTISGLFGDAVRAVLVGLAVMVPTLSLLALMSYRLRFPWLGTVLVWMLCSQLLFGDNHDVRTLPGKTQAAGIGTAPACDLGRKTLRRPIDGVVRDTIGETFENWWAANARLTAPIATSIPGNHPPLTAPPFIMVATAGGASRAAFWTSQVLGEIARREADFAERVFMISGVSGGSLGATTFRSIVEADRRAGADGVILRQAAPRSANFLTNDFLTPALGVGLYVDLPLHAFAFLPRGWRPNDRAAALEQAWEHFSHGVVDHAGTEPFRWSEGFVSTFSTRKPVWPILALNGTSVEKGKRIVVSNVDFACSGLSSEIARYDGMAVLGSDIAISTAVTMSARFPVISPTGGMRVNDTVQMRVTDGGLFENFGAVTADEVLRYVVERRGDVQRAERPVVPVAILISSDPSLDPLDRATLTGIVADRVVSRPVCDAPDPFPAHPGNNWPECPVAGRATATILADPLLSLYDGRVARGEMAAVSLLDRITANRVSVRDGLRDRLMRNTEKARTEAGEDLQGYRHALNRSFHDVQRRLGTRHHIDFFHFRQCRLIKQKTPTMSWHDSPEAWTAMQVMIGLEPGSGDECGNGAEFFRLCVRLARLTGDSATDEAATERCAGRWPKPNGWTCEMFEGESLCLMKPAGG